MANKSGEDSDFKSKIRAELNDREKQNGNGNLAVVDIRTVTWDDVYFTDGVKKDLESIIDYLKDPEPFGTEMGYSGILFKGSPGTGKTLACLLVANYSKATTFVVNTLPERKAEEYIKELFKQAREKAPALILLNECEKYFTKRQDIADISDVRIVDQFLAEMDGFQKNKGVVVVADTNQPDSLDSALRRPGRFDKEINFGPPDDAGRKKIIEIHLNKDHIYQVGAENLGKLVENSYGFTGGDVKGLLKEAFSQAHRRMLLELKKKYSDEWTESKEWAKIKEGKIDVIKEDLDAALSVSYPSALRGFFFKKPTKKFSDLGGYGELKRKLEMEIVLPLKHPELYKKYGRERSAGIMLYGPPRNGKSVLGEAVAAEAKANLMVVRGPEIYNSLFGNSEEIVREIKRKAVEAAPVVLMFDEADAVASRRRSYGDKITDSITSQLLAEFSPIPKGVSLILTTNKPDKIDDAFLAPGRVEKHFYVGLPEFEDRKAILEFYFSKIPGQKKLDFKKLAESTEGYTSAHIESLYNNTVDYMILKEIIGEKPKISTDIILGFLPKEKPELDTEYWDAMMKKLGNG